MSRLSDLALMSIALDEAQQVSVKDVHPNPRVGAAILCPNGQEFSAHHSKAGEAHAEAKVLGLCRKNNVPTEGATMAVTLEPCSHHGKTPPCADAIIQAGIQRVLIAGGDPFEEVSGEGIKKLESAGIEVRSGLMQKEAEELNKEWLHAHRKRRPFVTLKMATSIDGKWKTQKGEDRWVTSESARLDAHLLRAKAQGLLTSSKSILEDDPQMTARDKNGHLLDAQPQPYVLSRQDFKIDEDFQVAKHPLKAKVLCAATIEDTLSRLYDQKIYHLMVEAGPKLSQAFMESGLTDEIVMYMETHFYGKSEYQFQDAFHEGLLPGNEWRIYSVAQFGASTIKLVLTPKAS